MNEHSAKFDKVRSYYQTYLKTGRGWNEEMVRNAVGKWITAEEAEEILAEKND